VREALSAGYRPCRRCRPTVPVGEAPEWVARLLEVAEQDPERRLRDADLRRLGVVPDRARDWFRRHHGMTFHAYCRGLRLAGALDRLRQGESIDEAAYGSGYESLSGFRDAFARRFGAPPGKGRATAVVAARQVATPLGPMLAAATADGLCLLEYTDRRALERELEELARRLGATAAPGKSSHLDLLEEELRRYFAGELREFTVPLVTLGSPFEERVWEELRRIPYGATKSYGQLARALGQPGAPRAVGRANGRNRLAIVIPCHRVINEGGKLGGYGGGLWRKQFLLDLERGARRLPVADATQAS
jgi:AraC family transcriptional regulator of adaptative response/methylated-DNA-[protein]-cysteine methyltransferase